MGRCETKFSGLGLLKAFLISMQAAKVCQGSSESSHHDESTFSNGASADAMMSSKFSLANASLFKGDQGK